MCGVFEGQGPRCCVAVAVVLSGAAGRCLVLQLPQEVSGSAAGTGTHAGTGAWPVPHQDCSLAGAGCSGGSWEDAVSALLRHPRRLQWM